MYNNINISLLLFITLFLLFVILISLAINVRYGNTKHHDLLFIFPANNALSFITGIERFVFNIFVGLIIIIGLLI
jgi:hypothetical protein